MRPFLHIHAGGIWIKKTTLEQLEEVGLKVVQQEHKIQICRIGKISGEKGGQPDENRILFSLRTVQQWFALTEMCRNTV